MDPLRGLGTRRSSAFLPGAHPFLHSMRRMLLYVQCPTSKLESAEPQATSRAGLAAGHRQREKFEAIGPGAWFPERTLPSTESLHLRRQSDGSGVSTQHVPLVASNNRTGIWP